MVSPSTRKKKTSARVSSGGDIGVVGWVGILTGKYLDCQMWLRYINVVIVTWGVSEYVDIVAQGGMGEENTLIMCDTP